MQLNARFRLADYGVKLQKPAPKDVYLGLRNLALRITREKTGLVATFVPTEPRDVVIMDWVVSQGDGHSNRILQQARGGFIGGGESHESVRNAAKKMVVVTVDASRSRTQPQNIRCPNNRVRSSFTCLVMPKFSLRVLQRRI
jgi:hypothetical protein